MAYLVNECTKQIMVKCGMWTPVLVAVLKPFYFNTWWIVLGLGYGNGCPVYIWL